MVERYIRDVEAARSNRVTPIVKVVDMTNLEMEFFEEYKSVDNICRDMYQAEQGVTEYINQMEAMDLQGSRRVVNWNEKYKKLKHLRWLRNQIAHENAAPDLMENDLIELDSGTMRNNSLITGKYRLIMIIMVLLVKMLLVV